MLKAFSRLWLAMPPRVRRLAVLVKQTLFTVTVGAVVVDVDNKGRVLLCEHVFRSKPWGSPGGFVQKGESPEQAIRREVREETGLELEDLRLCFTRTSPKIAQIEIIFSGRASGEPRPDGFEIKQVRWFALDSLPPDLPPDQLDLIEHVLGRSAVDRGHRGSRMDEMELSWAAQ